MSRLAAFLDTNARALLTLIPELRDAKTRAVHDARVATRRLRAALRLIQPRDGLPPLDELRSLMRRTARALGRVRDLDVAMELLEQLERRAPAAAAAAAFARRELSREQMTARRRLVKRLDDLPLDMVPTLIRAVPPLNHGLGQRARAQAGEVVRSVDHASGVYFPRRAHAARIEIKKLRYLIEFHDPSDRAALKTLRRAQEVLGDIQDRQVVSGMIERLIEAQPAPEVELHPLLTLLEAECSVLYDRFLERRAEVLALCERLASVPVATRPAVIAGTLLSASAVVAGSVLQFRRSRAS